MADVSGAYAPGRRSVRTRFAVVALSIVASFAAGCGDEDSSSSASSETKADSERQAHRIAYLSPLEANSFIQAFGTGVKEAAEAAGADLTVFDANGNPATQINQIQSAASSGKYDGFVIVTFDGASLVPALTKAVKTDGVKAVCAYTICGPDPIATTNQLPGVVTTQVGISADEEGRQVAEATTQACENIDPCEVAYIPGTLTVGTTRARLDAFMDAIEPAANIEIKASEQSGQDNPAAALSVTRDLLTAHPGLDVVATAGDQMADGAQKAITGAGKLGDIKIIGLGGSQLGVDRVADGTWFADAAPEYPVTYARLGTEALIDALDGKDVPDYIDALDGIDKPRVITEQNVADFTPAEWTGK